MSADTLPVVVTRTFRQPDLDDFGLVSGGSGRIHTDPDYAAGTPFGRPVVQGLLLLAVVEEALCRARPDWRSAGEVEVGYRAPVLVGDTVTVEVSADGTGTGLRIEGSTPGGVVLVGAAHPPSGAGADDRG